MTDSADAEDTEVFRSPGTVWADGVSTFAPERLEVSLLVNCADLFGGLTNADACRCCEMDWGSEVSRPSMWIYETSGCP